MRDEATYEGVEIIPVREAHRLDEAALEGYLRAFVEGFRGPLVVRQFEGGQSNPTYFLEAGGRHYVMRKKPPGKLLPSAHAVEREYRRRGVNRSFVGEKLHRPCGRLYKAFGYEAIETHYSKWWGN